MEDQRRELDSTHKEIHPIREKSVDPKELTIMVIRSVGKIRSFKISRHIIFLTSIFFLAFIFSSLFIFNRFFDLRYKYKIQSENLERLETKFNKNETLLIKTRQYVAAQEDYIQNIIKENRNDNTDIQKERPKTNQVIASDAVRVLEKKNEGFNNVEIKDFTIMKENNGFIVDFKLANTQSEENASEGYIHIIAMDVNNDFPPEWNYQHDKLKDGIPVNYNHGQPFLIQRFKNYSRQFNMNSNSELPAVLRVLVYDRSGSLILKNEFEVDNEF